MRTLLRSLSTVALLLFPLGATARPNVPREQLDFLESGGVLEYSQKVAGSNVMMGKAIVVLRDTPEAALHVLLDVASYKHFMPRVKESRITKRVGQHTFAVIETALPWPVKDAWVYIKYTTYPKPGRVYECKWWMLNGTMKAYGGHALIEPWTTDAKQSTLTYAIQAEPKTSAPDSMISTGVRRISRIFVDRVRLRLQALRKFGKLPKGI